MNNLQELYKLADILITSGVQTLPVIPNGKRPPFNDWQDYYLDMDTAHRFISKGFGIGIKPNNDFIYIDIDNDHKSDSKGSDSLTGIITPDELKTLSQTKLGGNNRHLFYKYNDRYKGRFTGNQELLKGVEVSSERSFIRVFPNYQFDTRELLEVGNFYECLNDFPSSLQPFFTHSNIITPRRNKKRLDGNIRAYLRKVQPFTEGSRQQSYRMLIFNMVIKNEMPYNDVVKAVEEWDRENGNYQDEEPDQFYHALRDPRGGK